MKIFDKNNQLLRCQFDNVAWINDSGVSREELARMCDELAKSTASLPRTLQKAKLFALKSSEAQAMPINPLLFDQI